MYFEPGGAVRAREIAKKASIVGSRAAAIRETRGRSPRGSTSVTTADCQGKSSQESSQVKSQVKRDPPPYPSTPTTTEGVQRMVASTVPETFSTFQDPYLKRCILVFIVKFIQVKSIHKQQTT